jgi:hypothetical protein
MEERRHTMNNATHPPVHVLTDVTFKIISKF